MREKNENEAIEGNCYFLLQVYIFHNESKKRDDIRMKISIQSLQ